MPRALLQGSEEAEPVRAPCKRRRRKPRRSGFGVCASGSFGARAASLCSQETANCCEPSRLSAPFDEPLSSGGDVEERRGWGEADRDRARPAPPQPRHADGGATARQREAAPPCRELESHKKPRLPGGPLLDQLFQSARRHFPLQIVIFVIIHLT